MKYGLLLATGKLGWESTLEVAAGLRRRLRDRMATCNLDVVNHNGATALFRFMYTEHGCDVPTLHDGGSHVQYREVATALWERLRQRQTGRPCGRHAGALAGWPMSVKLTERRAVWCSLVRALPLVEEWPSSRGGDPFPTPLMGRFYELMVWRLGHQVGPFVWPQATGGPKPLVSDLLPGPMVPIQSGSRAPWRNSLLPEAAAPRARVCVTLTRQQRFDQALMHAAHGVARCATIACQGLQEQRNEPLSEDSLVAAYTLGRHFAKNMRVPMEDCSELLMRCSPFSPEVPHNHLGGLHAVVRVVYNAWRDDGGLEMLNESVALLEEAGVYLAYTQHLSPQGHPGGDPNDSTSSTIAQGHGAPVLAAQDHPSSESANPTLSSSTQGHGPPPGARSMGSHGMLPRGRGLSLQGPPRGAVTNSTASVAVQGHGAPDHRPQDCPTCESPCIASMVNPTGVLTPQSPAPPAVVDAAYLTPAATDGEAASCLEDSPVPLAQWPKEPVAVDFSPCSTNTVATVRACSLSSSDSVTAQVEYPTCLEHSPVRRKCPWITPPSNAGVAPPLKSAKVKQGTKKGPVDCDAPLGTVQRKPIKANQTWDLPTIGFLKLRLLPD